MGVWRHTHLPPNCHLYWLHNVFSGKYLLRNSGSCLPCWMCQAPVCQVCFLCFCVNFPLFGNRRRRKLIYPVWLGWSAEVNTPEQLLLGYVLVYVKVRHKYLMFGRFSAPSLTIWENEVLTSCQLRCLVSFHKSIWVEANEKYWKKGSPLTSGKTVLEGDWRNLLLITYQMNLSQYIKRLHCINVKVIWAGYSALRVKPAGITAFLSPVVLLVLDELKKKVKTSSVICSTHL